MQTAIPNLAARIVAGDVRALARGATLVESRTQDGKDLVASLFARTGRAIIVGITGPPGAGKSTLVNQLIKCLRSNGQGQVVGIIAVDPSSPFSKGAILGDRIRMQDHHSDPGVFIRSMATRGKLGGIAHSTLDLALLLDAAGCNVVLIETVGVGQDEVDITQLADVTVLVLTPAFGDDVQAIKAGVMEIADVFVINKADLPGADRLESDIKGMQSFAVSSDGRSAAPVHRVAALSGEGVSELWVLIHSAYENRVRSASHINRWAFRLRELLRDSLWEALPETEIFTAAEKVAARLNDPYTVVDELRSRLLRK